MIPQLLFLVLVIFRISVNSVRTCYFCADFFENCDANDRSDTPKKMNCDTFKVNREQSMLEYFREPNFLTNYDIYHLFGPALSERNVKKLCIKVVYGYKDHNGIYDDGKNFVSYQELRNLTFQSCMFERFAYYKNACDYFQQRMGRKIKNVSLFDFYHCQTCRRHECNGQSRTGFSWDLGLVCLIFVYLVARD
ncbi:uncharacterized protein LOC656531 [Tribolium castaneum]|uniref:Protein quiver n=1 Tax=Tribolium castaneum TaxID=7070 RepID=A0A139WDW6_TRICA|nr:PREDICTED: uncharacterized protein LOC656531 [Tribolium castaneum]KYB26133.1 hypothetical protein TcasGA2_TC033987 [Tribolium castaneum]|eukprot:XP_008196561.1 PREDICTED: uncharacterized protein LOC656531 [Tribolium castaneum]